MEDKLNKFREGSILYHFSNVEDTRANNSWHNLIEIIAIAICAVIAGADDWVCVQLWADSNYNWLKKFLTLKHGIPSHDTFGRVFAMINPEEFQTCFNEWVQSISTIFDGEIVSIDGKTVRHSYDTGSNKSAIHVVSAWANSNNLVLGQIKVNEKSNEITAIPQLLDMLSIKGCIVTIDAMGCQKDIAENIVDQEADYVLALKGNHGTLYEDVKMFIDDAYETSFKYNHFDYHKTFDNDHGRIEKREYWCTDEIDWLDERSQWKHFKTIGMVRVERTVKEKTTIENRYYISSLEPNAEIFAKAVRGHWGIENSLHWVLDVAFREDDSRVRKENAPENLTVLRHIAINLLKKDKTTKCGIKNRRKKAGWDNEYLRKILLEN